LELLRQAQARRAPNAIGTRTLAVALVAGAALLAVTWALVPKTATGADLAAFDVLAATRGSLVAHLIRAISIVGPALLALVSFVIAVCLVRGGRIAEAAVIAIGGPATLLAAHLAKSIALRPRPRGELIHAGGHSFPSTDAALSVLVIVLAIALEGGAFRGASRGRLVAGAVLVALVTGILLIVVRTHYLTDVLAGWGLGTAVFAACGLLAVATCTVTAGRSRHGG